MQLNSPGLFEVSPVTSPVSMRFSEPGTGRQSSPAEYLYYNNRVREISATSIQDYATPFVVYRVIRTGMTDVVGAGPGHVNETDQ